MNYKQLTEIERYQIQSFLKAGYTKKRIAQELGRHPSTIGRELDRNTGLRGYRPQQAQRLAEGRKTLHCHTLINQSTWQNVEDLLRNEWSPEQISLWLKTFCGIAISNLISEGFYPMVTDSGIFTGGSVQGFFDGEQAFLGNDGLPCITAKL